MNKYVLKNISTQLNFLEYNNERVMYDKILFGQE